MARRSKQSEDCSTKATPYSEITHQIRVSVIPRVIAKESDPGSGVYAFGYTVTIENLGCDTVQLLERHWKVMSAEVQIAEVVGPGVVGEQPVLEAGRDARMLRFDTDLAHD